MGTSVCPLCPLLLTGCGLLTAFEDAKVWRGLCCSTEAQDGEEEAEEEEEEEERGRLWGEAGGPVGFSFSIMVLKSLGGGGIPDSAKLLFVSAAQCECVRVSPSGVLISV